MKRKYYVLILSILLVAIIAICVFVGRDKSEETVNPQGETEQKQQVDHDDEGIMEDQVFEEDDSTEKNEETEKNNTFQNPSDSDEKNPTQDVQDGSGEEVPEEDTETEEPEESSLELPRVPLN